GSGRVVVACPGDDPATASIPDDADVAVFALDRELHSVLLRGRATGRGRIAGSSLSTLDIDWVYNSMPPKHGQIYPQVSC
ncbi:MAG TPA: hypothetical protein VFO62_05320, partial [Candidatus Binatia bacterium]|nr:hypothetical protein [Candidatus Binatia bacterium]